MTAHCTYSSRDGTQHGALTDNGALFCWVSSDPNLRCQQSYSLCQRNVVSFSAGRYWSAAVTITGDVYMWDGKKEKDKPPGKQHESLSHGPKTQTTTFEVTSGQGSPSDFAGMNRWFKPKVDAPSSIRVIQIEEKAMKDLKQFYSSIKIVKNQS